MEYLYNNEWKELKKQKRYKEAAKILADEIALNCVRVHNKYSDIKMNEIPDNVASLDFGRNSTNKRIEKIETIYEIGNDICGYVAMYDAMDYEGEEYDEKDQLKRYEKIHKKFLNCFEKELKNE